MYSFLITLSQWLLPLSSVLSKKMRLFVTGRKEVFSILENELDTDVPTIWFHAASLGEYEQGVPVMQEIKKRYATHPVSYTHLTLPTILLV